MLAYVVVDTDSYPGRVTLAYGETWPSTRGIANSVTITMVAGYGSTAASVPAEAKQAIRLLVGDWMENREDTQAGSFHSIPTGLEALVSCIGMDGYR